MTETTHQTKPDQLHLAPMRGLTDVVYRHVFCRHFQGIDSAMAPFIPAGTHPRLGRQLRSELAPEYNRSLAVTPQILGNQPAEFLATSRLLAEMGYDEVNWNLGCPFPKVAKKFRGSGLLPDPDRIDRFLDTVIPALPGRLSVKVRLGRRDPDEILDLIPVFNRYPLAAVVIHPRTGIQMYDGRPDRETFAACLDRLEAPVVYNGDIFQASDFQQLKMLFPNVDAWMIGRGVLYNPMLPEEIRGDHTAREAGVERFRRFHDDLVAAYGERLSGPGHLLGKMKGFWTYFARFFSSSHSIAKRLHRTHSLDHFMEMTRAVFGGEKGSRVRGFKGSSEKTI